MCDRVLTVFDYRHYVVLDFLGVWTDDEVWLLYCVVESLVHTLNVVTDHGRG